MSVTKNWWKVPLYCIVASCVCCQLELKLFKEFALVTLPDGSVSSDPSKVLFLSALLFVFVVLFGGFVIFRKMPRNEVLQSVLIAVGINIVMGLLSAASNMVALIWLPLTEWQSVVGQLLVLLTDNKWIVSIISWIVPPFVFVLFGKRS